MLTLRLNLVAIFLQPRYNKTNMNNTISYKGYNGSVEFSESDGVFYGKVQGVKSLISYEQKSLFTTFTKRLTTTCALARLEPRH